MDAMAIHEGLSIVIVLGGAVTALFSLLALGLCRSAAEGDEALYEAYHEARAEPVETDVFDREAREWIAERRAS